MRGQLVVLALAFALFAPSAMPAGTQSRLWQEGELLSRKTVPAQRTFLRNQYVYRVRGPNCGYLVVFDAPLEVDLRVPMKISVDRKQLFVIDVDGKERKARIWQRVGPGRRR